MKRTTNTALLVCKELQI